MSFYFDFPLSVATDGDFFSGIPFLMGDFCCF
jgi:hypothetical protein